METLAEKGRAVKYDKFGDTTVLHIDEVPVSLPTGDQVLVKVKATGINPAETKIREGLMAKNWPSTFPSGQGSDFAGVVESVGEKVKNFKAGDEVMGFTDHRASQADYVTVDAGNLVLKPAHVSWEQAGSLYTSGTTAYAALKAVDLKKGDTLVVSSAAGGVGSIVVQLAVNLGARVIGLAGESNHPWLSKHGVIPVAYGDGMAQRIKAAVQGATEGATQATAAAQQTTADSKTKTSEGKIDAFIDTHGQGYVELAISLGVDPQRIDTIVDFAAAKKYHTKTDGSLADAKASVIGDLANLIEEGRLDIPIAKVYNLNDVRDAYQELEKHHTHGKIVLVP